MFGLHQARCRGSQPARSLRRASRFRPRLEGLESRWLPSTIIDLGPGSAAGLNSLGQVVGSFFFSGMASHAFLWDADHGLQDLGTLTGIGQSGAAGINAAGQVVGISSTDAVVPTHAFVWDADPGMQDLGTLGGNLSSARGINDAGQIAGYSDLPGQGTDAVLWDADGIHDLGTLGGSGAQANAINDAGQVVGLSIVPSGVIHAFLWDSKNGMQDLGTLGGDYSFANGVNEVGQVVGSSAPQGSLQQHAFVWDADSGMHDLGTLPSGNTSSAAAINNSGLIVGSSFSTRSGTRAVLWDANGITDLNDLLPPGSGWTLIVASAVNAAGQVVGFGIFNGEQHAFLLTPDGAPHAGWHPAGPAGAPLREVAGALAATAPPAPPAFAPRVYELPVALGLDRLDVGVVDPGTATASPGREFSSLFAGWHHRDAARQTASKVGDPASGNPVNETPDPV